MKSPFLLLLFAVLFIYFMVEISRNSLENEVNFMSHSLVVGKTASAKAEILVCSRGFRAYDSRSDRIKDGHGSSVESSVSKKEENVLVVGREYGRGKEESDGKVTAIELATSWASSRKGNQVIVASLMQTIQEEFVEFAVVKQVVQETAKDSSFTFLPSKTDILPGHLGILKLRLCKGQQEEDLSYLFTRRLDSRLFRLYNPATKESIAGPLSTDHHPGRLINFACMHGGKDDSLVVFSVQYNNKLDGAADGEFDITFSIFSYSKTEKSWSQSILENTRLQGMTDNYIEADQLDQLYFLSNPVLALNRDSTLVYFVFRKHIYTVHRRSESDEYSLYTQSIGHQLYFADFYIDYIQVLEESTGMQHSAEKEGDNSLLLLVSEQKRVYLFTCNETLTPTSSSYSLFHQFITGPLSTIYTALFDSLFIPGNVVLQCFQLLLFPDDILSVFSLADTGFHSMIQSPIGAYNFHLLAMWSGTTAISKSTRIKALDFTNSKDDGVVLLLESGDLVLLNPSSLGDGVKKSWLTGPFLTFVMEKYLLVTVCLLVVALFLVNEVKPDGHAQSQALFLGLVYIVLFVMTFGIIFLE